MADSPALPTAWGDDGHQTAFVKKSACGLARTLMLQSVGNGVRRAKKQPRMVQDRGILARCAHEFHGIDGLAIPAHFEVNVWPARAARGSEQRKHLPLLDRFSDLDEILLVVGIERRIAVAVINLDGITKSPATT